MAFVVDVMIVCDCHSGFLNNFDLDCGNDLDCNVDLLKEFVVSDHTHVGNFDCNLAIWIETVFDKIELGSTYLGHFLSFLEICFGQKMSFVVT